MNNSARPTEIYFKSSKTGPRAYRFSRMQFRSFPIGYDKAKMMVATGEAVVIDKPFTKYGAA